MPEVVQLRPVAPQQAAGRSAPRPPAAARSAPTASGTSPSTTAPPADLAGLAGRIAPRPILLVRALHGNEDEVLNRVPLRRAGPPKALWEVGRGGHTGALEAVPEQYERRVAGFFDRVLPGR